MTAATTKPEFKVLARKLADESIVTKALSRFLEQIFEEVHAAEIAPLQAANADLTKSLREMRERLIKVRDASQFSPAGQHEINEIIAASWRVLNFEGKPA
jgi:hypothetical protein